MRKKQTQHVPDKATRQEVRNYKADQHLKDKSFFQKAWGRLHLSIANTREDIESAAGKPFLHALAGGTIGAVKASAIAFVVTAIFLGTIGAAGALIIGAAGLLFGSANAYSCYRDAVAHDSEKKAARRADTTAERGHAIPRNVSESISKAIADSTEKHSNMAEAQEEEPQKDRLGRETSNQTRTTFRDRERARATASVHQR